jgi:hypothetical protein
MDTNRNLLFKICIASLAVFATAASAQTIYKQVDADGRVMFTDRPSSQARVIASYETSKPARRQDTEAEAAAEPGRVRAGAEDRGPIAQNASTPPEPRALRESVAPPEIRTVQDFRGAGATEIPSTPAPKAIIRAVAANDVERAVTTYTPLQSPLALQADATEAARRARQEMNKVAASGVLIVKPVPREREPIQTHEGITAFYVLWAGTFFLLAAGLLYVGFQTLRLILRGAFPRWELGLA